MSLKLQLLLLFSLIIASLADNTTTLTTSNLILSDLIYPFRCPPCPINQVCISGRCVSLVPTCDTIRCRAGYRCVGGRCIPYIIYNPIPCYGPGCGLELPTDPLGPIINPAINTISQVGNIVATP